MGDVLKYRIPQQEKVSKTGRFEQCDTNVQPNGFVVTSFEGDACFQFIESTSENQTFHFNTECKGTSQSEYTKSANQLIAELKLSGGKAILSRIKPLDLSIHPDTFFDDLCSEYPTAFVYLVSSPLLGTWIGATPEALLERTDRKGTTMALAGTRKSGSVIPWTEKEFEEHQLVADFIEESAIKAELDGMRRSSREEMESGPVKHLLTRFEFDLRKNQDWPFAMAMHPTPAVSGFPRDRALKLIDKIEHHNRLIYAGIIGVLEDETHLYVNLRCAQITENEVFLYLGGGFTKDSVVEDEWEETENKAKTLLNVLKKQ
mgnify:CR=1 FL=1